MQLSKAAEIQLHDRTHASYISRLIIIHWLEAPDISII